MWYIEAWEKRGNQLALEIELPRLKVGTVRRLFGVRPNDPVYGGLRPLRAPHLKELVRFARRQVGAARLGTYDCYLGYYFESWDTRRDPRFRGDYPAPRVLRGFPEARRVKPRRAI
jgi:hypothetical protein